MLSASLHIDCACALPVPRHFLATWRRPPTFSVAFPPTHAGSRCQGCGLKLVCAIVYSTDDSTARACLSCVPLRSLARLLVGRRCVGGANAYDGVQPRTLFVRLRLLETSTAHDSSHLTRVQPFRAAGPHASLVSSSLSRVQNPGGAAWPCVPAEQPRGKTFRTHHTFSSRMCACVDSGSSCKHDARVLQLHGLLASCRSKGTARLWGWSAWLFY